EYFANLRGGVEAAYQQKLIERLDLDPSRKFKEYAKGNKQKGGLVVALQHRPDLLMLDEPTSGLDPLVQQTFYELIREAKAEGRTIFLSSHILSEVEKTCDRVAIIRDGRLVKVDRTEALRDLAHHEVELRFAGDPPMGAFAVLPGVSDVTADGNVLKMRVSGSITPVVREAAKCELLDFVSREPSLEETFLAQYGRGTAEAARHDLGSRPAPGADRPDDHGALTSFEDLRVRKHLRQDDARLTARRDRHVDRPGAPPDRRQLHDRPAVQHPRIAAGTRQCGCSGSRDPAGVGRQGDQCRLARRLPSIQVRDVPPGDHEYLGDHRVVREPGDRSASRENGVRVLDLDDTAPDRAREAGRAPYRPGDRRRRRLPVAAPRRPDGQRSPGRRDHGCDGGRVRGSAVTAEWTLWGS